MADESREPEDREAVRDGGAVWVGLDTFAPATLNRALQLMAVSDMSDGGALERYRLNETGRVLLSDPSQADVLRGLILAGRNITSRGGRIVALEP